jgi:hypothetical protein
VIEAMPPGTRGYVDRDWLDASAPEALPAVIVEEGAPAPDEAAAGALLSVARAAAAAVEFVEDAPVEVVGTGMIARAVRELIGLTAQASAGAAAAAPPGVIVEATGDPESIRTAIARLADLGTLVLAGESRGRLLAIELYPDVHLRGLTIVATGPLPDASRREAAHAGSLASLFEESLRTVAPGEDPPADGLWFRVEPEDRA